MKHRNAIPSLPGPAGLAQRGRHGQHGFTLIEVGVVLILVALFAAFVIYPRFAANRDSQNVTNVAGDLTTIAAKTSGLFPPPGNFAALGTGVSTANCGVLVDNRIFAGTSLRGTAAAAGGGGGAGTPAVVNHPFDDGTISCGPATLVNANDGFTIQFDGLRNNVCSELVRSAQGNARRVSVNGTVVKALNGALNPATLGTQCTAAGTDEAQVVAFDFGR
jgi:prepilin-type N-terminal cleavage/methylation domain-containing protein